MSSNLYLARDTSYFAFLALSLLPCQLDTLASTSNTKPYFVKSSLFCERDMATTHLFML